MTDAVLTVAGLTVRTSGGAAIVEDVSMTVGRGEVLGLVGESGSGKTTTALALLGFARTGTRIAEGSVRVAGHEFAGIGEAALRPLRGRLVSYVPQDPTAALNPALRVGESIGDMLRAHAPGRERADAVLEALGRVDLPPERRFASRYPHELSGGQQQRVAIGSALACVPPLVVLDEPTTGLDVVTQARILNEIDRLRREHGLAVVYVSHDLAVVGQVADRIAVMYAGRIVEEGPTTALLERPRHPYTRGLVASIPDHAEPRRLRGIPGVAVGVGERPTGCAFAPRCPQHVPACDERVPPLTATVDGGAVRCIRWQATPPLERELPLALPAASEETPLLQVEGLRAEYRGRGETVIAAETVSFSVRRAECVALVGESGSGKTTIARCVAGLHRPAAGRIVLDGVELASHASGRDRQARRRIQIVFQNPNESLNPRHRVRDAVARPAILLRGLSRREADAETARLLELVRLPSRLARRFPRELSGGERQRVAIARALAAEPDLVVCDEVTSALDVSVQAAVLDLLASLRRDLGLALLFITHDLGVVAAIADRVLVLERGEIREHGPVRDVLDRPADDYTRRLLEAAPRLGAVTGSAAS